MIFEPNLASWTCCQREKTADCQPLPFSTSFKFAAPASVFEATRKIYQNMWKNIGFLKQDLHHGHAANAKKQLTVSLCHFPQASNLPRLPVFLKPHAKYAEKHRILETNLTSWTSTKVQNVCFSTVKCNFCILHGACYDINGDRPRGRKKIDPRRCTFLL